jgi:hypothetical protein
LRKFLFFFCFISFSLSAQKELKNSLKVNAAGAVTGIISVQYERMLTSNWSFNNTFFYRDKSQIPLGPQFDKLAKKHSLGLTGVDFEYIFVDLAQIGVKGYSPELRRYFGDKNNRWFVGLFGQFEDFEATIPASLEARYDGQVYTLDKVPINFDIRTISGGLLIGKQFKFGKRLFLDFVIIGPHFGKAQKVYAAVETSILSRLNEGDKLFLRDKIIDRFRLSDQYFEVTVGDEKAEINAFKKVPYLGIRGVGLNLGFSF